MTTAARALHILVAVTAVGCEENVCEENLGAQTLDARVEVEIAGQTVSAELADDEVERERGWRKRACDREAILLVNDEPAPLPVWGCELTAPIAVYGIREGQIAFVDTLDPCGPPCGGCPRAGSEVVVDAVLEAPVGVIEAQRGDPVRW